MGPVDPALIRTFPSARRAASQIAVIGVTNGVLAIGQALCLAWVVTVLERQEPLDTPLIVLTFTVVARGLVAAT